MSNLKRVDVALADSPSADAFGRLRVSQLTTQLDVKYNHDDQPILVDEVTNGSASSTHSDSSSTVQMDTSASGDYIVRQTFQRMAYQSGKSQQVLMTFFGMDAEANVTKRIGYFSSSTTAPYTANFDGFYLENDGTNLKLVTAKNGTKTEVNQSSWVDPFDGTGPSGITHDFADNTIMFWDYEWLGVGRLRCCIVWEGSVYLLHEFNHQDQTGVYMTSPNQPLRWEMRQSGAGSGTMTTICATVGSEGAINEAGKDGGISDDNTHLNANSTSNWYYAVGLRLGASDPDTFVDILGANLKSNTNDDYEFRIVLNPTYSGSVTYNAVTDYSVEYGLGATANTVSAMGHILYAGFGTQASDKDFNLKTAIRLGTAIDGTQDEIVVIVKPHTSNLDIHRAINWREIL